MSAFSSRQAVVRSWLSENDVCAMVISSTANIRYLSGFTGEGHLVLFAGGGGLCTDGRYELQAAEESPELDCVLSSDGHLGAVIEYARAQGVERLGFEENVVTYAAYRRLEEEFGADALRATSSITQDARTVKDDDEIARIRRAAGIVDEALTGFLDQLQPGMTEKEAAFELDRRILTGGADAIAFQTILASGPSAACPHARPSSRVLREGDMVKVDVGGRVDGYCSDITRTVFLGDPDERFVEVYSLVYEAQGAALERVGPGAECRELDEIARQIISDGGYGDAFSHGLGHGVGLEVHEAPRLSARSTDTLAPGMVVTVEPGVYLEGWGGVRIEDLVLVTERGYEVLTGTPKWRDDCGR